MVRFLLSIDGFCALIVPDPVPMDLNHAPGFMSDRDDVQGCFNLSFNDLFLFWPGL